LASLIFLVFYVVVDFDRRDGGIEDTGNYLSKLQLLEFYSTEAEAEDAKESETTNQCK